MRYSEEFAKACFDVAAAPMRLQGIASQSRGEHDFDILDADGGKCGLLEVTCAMDSQHVSTLDAVFHRKHGGERVPRVRSKSDWGVHVRSQVDVRRVRENLDAYLARIEAEGLIEFDDHMLYSAPASVRAICQDLSVCRRRVVATSSPGAHWLLAPGVGAMASPHAVNEAVRIEAGKLDNIRKLSSDAVPLRHLFVCIDSSLIGAWAALTDEDLADPLVVDPAITHLWAAAFPGSRGKAVVWHAANGESWKSRTCDISGSKWDSLVT